MAQAAPRRESNHELGPLFGGFYLFLAGGNSRGVFQQNIHQFSRYTLLGSWSPLIGQWQGRGSFVIAVGPGITHLVLPLFWAWS